ncbi:hypothetical protein ACFLRC_01495 [Candidatus Altiarchaeota archaeon]
MDKLKNLGYALFGVGIILVIIAFPLSFAASILQSNLFVIIGPILWVLGWASISLSLLVLFVYVLIDRIKEVKEDDLGDHTKY